MISVMNSDCEFNRKSDTMIEEAEAKPRVSGEAENFSNSGVANEARVSSMVFDSVAPEGERSEEFQVRDRVSPESNSDNINNDTSSMDNKTESGVFELRASANQMDSQDGDRFEGRNDEFDDKNDTVEAKNDRTVGDAPRAEGHIEVYKSLLSEFDDYVANEKMNAGTSRALSYGFEVGDMVWGKVKSHPWWPGHIFNEGFASSSVRRTRRDGHVLVAFFGDSSYGWFDPAELIPFDAHFMEKSQQLNSRTFVKAVEEAVDEASRRRGLGLACKCRNPYNFRPTNVQGYFTVDVPDYEPGGLYSVSQIKKARDSFQPTEILSFVRQLASSPRFCDQTSIDFIKNKATVSAFRKAVFEEFDETYAQAFGVQPTRPSHDRANVLAQSAKQPTKAPLSGPLVIAETLGGAKSSKKSMKVKDQSKKDRYLFKRRDEPDVALDSCVTDVSQGKAEMMVDIKNEECAKMSRAFEGFPQSEPSFSMGEEGDIGLDQVQGSRMGARPLPVGVKRSAKMNPDGKLKKPKSLKRPLGDLSSEKPMVGEQKKKKKKKELGTPPNSDHQKRSASNSTKKSAQAGLGPSEDQQLNNQKKDGGASTSALGSVEILPGVTTVNIEVGLPQLLRDLHALALDPFHGAERNCPSTIRQCFLRFRSLVYMKSLVLSPLSDTESVEGRAAKSSSSIGTSGENVRDLPASKPIKQLARPEDPTKAGRKRLPSDRQEEIAAKRLKKINQMKSLTSEKKSSQRALDGQRVEGKEHAAVPLARPVKPGFAKKLEPPSRAVQPTMLVMKFPPETSLPSAAELKARFGRFGSLDQSAIRVFWKSFTCRVVFKHKADAQAAYKYANGNNTLFGNVKVRYILREVEAPAPEVPDFDKVRGDESSYETPRIKDPVADRPTPAPGLLPQPNIQLKSCLKKPASDEGGQVAMGNGTKGTARVKFMLGGEESNRGEQMMVGNRNNFNNNNNASFADGGAASSSSVAMDFNSKNFQKVVPPFSSSLGIPPHSQYAKPLYNNTHLTDVAPPRNSHNLNTPTISPPPPPPSAPSIDISQQMLSLLTRCNDVVTNVTGLLGYVPYHPL
ncbi:hypothetical protein CISIN_1g001012mg [Citrus sinensis]|uniref:PWWP domain-containing protein n=1 Tax=Citrus sinensis TaxID=2711 RepID=A0A067EZ93_CITSI|nr:hypothetical protein CISIN_1g001012mg [Citrus sinensis]